MSPAKAPQQTNEEIEFPPWIPKAAQGRIVELCATPLGEDKEYHALLERLSKNLAMKTEVWGKLPSEPNGFEGRIIDWAFRAFTFFPHLPRHPKTRSGWKKWATHIHQRQPLPDPAHLAELAFILLEETLIGPAFGKGTNQSPPIKPSSFWISFDYSICSLIRNIAPIFPRFPKLSDGIKKPGRSFLPSIYLNV